MRRRKRGGRHAKRQSNFSPPCGVLYVYSMAITVFMSGMFLAKRKLVNHTLR